MQASLAVLGGVSGIIGGWQRSDPAVMIAGVLLGSVVPFTLIVILPTNTRLLDPTLDPQGAELSQLLNRWGDSTRPKAVKFCHIAWALCADGAAKARVRIGGIRLGEGHHELLRAL